MNRNLLRCFRIPSLLLAGALQVLPIVRAALPITQSAANIIVIIFRWSAGAAAALGGVQAVSGASTTITSSLNKTATNGVPFSLRLTTAPDQAHYWLATGLPAGLTLSGTSGATLWSITGTPTVSGLFSVGLTAKDQSTSPASRTVTATLSLNVISSGPVAPSITTQPTNSTVVAGSSTVFTVVASGSPTPAYQWYFGTSPLSSQNNNTLALSGVTTGQAGSYTVVISNSAGSITSSVVTLTVNVPPGITQQPASTNVTAGQSATFDVTATGTAPLKYFWRKGTSTVAVQNTSSYTIPSALVTDAGSYSVIVSNVAGTFTSSSATLTVAAAPQAPSITTQPTNRTVVAGSSTAFAVVATGTPAPVFQWIFGSSPLSNQTNSTLTLSGVTTNQAGSYSVIITNSVGSITSSIASLAVIEPPSVIQHPANTNITAGQAAVFDVAASGTGPLKYFWRKSAVVVAVQTSSAYMIPSAQVADAGSYSVIVSNMAGAVTSSAATLTVAAAPQAPLITTQPSSATVVAGYATNFTVVANGNPTPVYQWYFGNSLLSNETNTTLTLSSVTTNQAGSYSVIITNSAGSITSSVVTLTVTPNPDATRPTVTVAAPAVATITVTSNSFRLTGTAKDNAALSSVQILRAIKPAISATGTSNWWAMVDLDPGTNLCQVVAFDMAGNRSMTNTKSIIFMVKRPLTLSVSGAGTVAGATNGQPLQVGRSYTLTATPKAGQVFSNWTGDVASSTNVLKFTMQSNLVINANFIPSPFIPVKGTYSGLFYETNEVRHGSSGFFNATVTPSGVFSGSLQTGVKKFPFTGRFSVTGKATNVVARAGTNSLTVELALALNGDDQITGRVTDGIWSAPVIADRAVFNAIANPAITFSNRYTVILPGNHTNSTNSPGGDGYGTVTVSRGGQLVFAGSMADGSKVTQSVPVSKTGQWPFYLPLYVGKGSALGWVAVTNTPTEDVSGLLSWIRPTGPSPKYYTNGFAIDVPLTGAAYTPPGTNRLFQTTNLTASFNGGNLSAPFTNGVSLAAGNKIVNTSSNKLALTITPATGLIQGTVTVPGGTTIRTIGGVMLQKHGFASGFFLGPNESGSVRLGP